MKELVLSLLSRGYGQAVQKNDGGQYGKLEIYFEPEDYFNWRSQYPLLRLSSSGRLLGIEDPTPPKTYSTRRGPLILYSEDLALSSCQNDKVNRKGRSTRDDAEVQLHTLQDLTEAILAYGKKQAKVAYHTSHTQVLSPFCKRATQHLNSYHRPAEKPYHVIQLSDEGKEEHPFSTGQGISLYPRTGQVRYQPRFFCFPQSHRPSPGPLPPLAQSLPLRHSEDRPPLAPGQHVTPKRTVPEDPVVNRNMKTAYRTAMRRQMSPVHETNTQEEFTGWPEDQTVTEHLTGYPKDISGQWKQSAMETGGEEGSHSQRPMYMDSSLGCSHLSRSTNHKRRMKGANQEGYVKQIAKDTCEKKGNIPPNPDFHHFHLPPVNQTLPSGPDTKDHEVKARSNIRENHKDSVPQLPDIHNSTISAETTFPKPKKRTILNKVFVLLPSQKEKDRLHGLPEDEDEREDRRPEKVEEREDVLCGGVKQKGEAIPNGGEDETLEYGRRLKDAEHDHLIWFDPEEDKGDQTNPGPIPALMGHKGPGKQSSMAFYRQDPHDSADQSEPQPGIIRGIIPMELRECEKGRALGTLILGPAGEIIRLSLWDALTDTEDHPVLDDATREHVLRVMRSREAAEEPWTILLEEQATQTVGTNILDMEAMPGHKEQVSANQENRNAAEHPKTENTECYGADGRTAEVQACAPEQQSQKPNHSAENQSHCKGEDTKIKSRGRTQGLQPAAGVTPGSPKPKSMSANTPPKTGLSTPTVEEEHFHHPKPETQTSINKDDAKIQSRKAGGGDDAAKTQIRKVKRESEVDQNARRITEKKFTQKKNEKTNMEMEAEETIYKRFTLKKNEKTNMELEAEETTADTTPGTVAEKTKTTEGKKSKGYTNQPKESTKPQNKVKKKTKAQAAFVVGKPRKSKKVQEVDKPEKHERATSKTEENKSGDETENEHCYSVPGQELDKDLVFVHQEEQTAAVSPITQSSAAVSFRTHHSAGASSRTNCSAASSSRLNSSAAVSFRSHSSAVVSPRICSSESTARQSSLRTSIAEAPQDGCSALLSLTQLPSYSAAPTNHSPKPIESESSIDVSLSQAKSSNEIINLRDTKAAALAEKAAAQAEKAERRRLEVERKRREKEEERRRQQEREEREERMRLELEEEQRKRSEQARLRKLRDEEEKRAQEERELERQRREQAAKEREKRMQEEKRRLLERLQRERQEEEERRAAELKRQQQEEEAQRELERRRLEEMEESERLEYLRRKQDEQEEKRKAAEERRRAEEAAALQAEEEARLLAQLTAKQRAALERQLWFNRSLFIEAGGLEQTHDVSRPWVFSYFSLLKLLGIMEPPKDLVKDVL